MKRGCNEKSFVLLSILGYALIVTNIVNFIANGNYIWTGINLVFLFLFWFTINKKG